MNDTPQNEATQNTSFLKKHPSFVAGFYAFCVIAASISFYFLVLRIDVVGSFFSKILGLLEPVVYGLTIAFLLNPIVKILEKLFLKAASGKAAKEISTKKKSAIRGFSVLIAIMVALLLIYLMASFLFPEIVDSLSNISKTLPKQVESLGVWASQILENNKSLSVNLDKVFSSATEYATNWIETDILSKINVWLGYITNGIASVFSVVFNLVVGLACSIYLMYNKEKFLGQCKKTIYAFLSPNRANSAISITKESVEILTHSIIGKIIDSIIIGFICFAGVKLLNMPYPVLISVIIGITNVIPFFGPWLGALPCGLLVLLTNPIQALYFGLFILALQQFDCNFLTPKIVGNYIGLPAFWVLISCLIGGGFYGVLGLILGTPVFAILYQIFGRYVGHKLELKDLPLKTSAYEPSGEILKDAIKSKE
ncbi:MAG: AI-2E family transporter [Oscillospiraceae bacterium]